MAEAPPSVEQLCQAVAIFYDPSSKSSDIWQQAKKWLDDIQHTVHAWSIADQALHQQPSDAVCFFAAQTLKQKIERNFRELPDNVHIQLRGSTIENIKKYSMAGKEAISTQLAIAIADLTMQMFPVWAKPVQDLIAWLSVEHGTRGCLLDILALLPEEVNNFSLSLSHEERVAVSHQIGLDCGDLFTFLEHCSKAYREDLAMLTKLFKCLAAWLAFGGEGTIGIEHKPLLPMAFEVLRANPDLMPEALQEAARDSISNALWLASDLQHHGSLNDALIPQIFELKPNLVDALAAESEAASMLGVVFVEMADNFIRQTVTGILRQQIDNIVKEILDVMTKFVQQKDYDICSLTFKFWYYVADGVEFETGEIRDQLRNIEKQINSCNRAGDSDQVAVLRPQRKQIYDAMLSQQAPFAPLYSMLYESLLYHIRCPDDLGGKLHHNDDLADRRERVMDLIFETSFVLGGEAFLNFFWQRCQGPEGQSWNGLEANLWMMNAVISKAQHDSSIAPQLLAALSGIGPEAHDQLYYTALKLTGNLSAWARERPEAVGAIWALLMKAIEARKHVGSVITHIKYLCTQCRVQVAPHLQDMRTLFARADELGIRKQDVMLLLQGAAKVVAHLPTESIQPVMEFLIGGIINIVREMSLAPGSEDRIVAELAKVAMFLKHVNIPRVEVQETHPLSGICTEIFRVLATINKNFAGHMRMIEESNRVLRHIIRNLGPHTLPLVQHILEMNTQLFQAHRHSSCLIVAKKIVDVFGDRQEFSEGMLAMVRALSGPTFALLNSQDAMIRNSDVAEDFFNLSTSVLMKAPQILFATELGDPSFSLGVNGMLLEERHAHSASADFMVAFVGIYRTKDGENANALKQAILPLVNKYGKQLVYHLIVAGTGQMQSHYLPELSDVLFEIHRLSMEMCHQWVQECLTSNPSTLARITPNQKAEFLNQFQKSHTQRGDFREIVLKPFCRLARPPERERER